MSTGASPWWKHRGLEAWLARAHAGDFGPPRRADDLTFLHHELEATHQICVVVEGCVEMHVQWAAGEARAWSIQSAPCLVGATEVTSGLPAYLGTARCVGPVVFHTLPPAAFTTLVEGDARLATEALANQSAVHGVTAVASLFNLARAEEQLATLLLTYAGVLGEPLDAPLVRLPLSRSQADLAAATGLGLRSVSRAISAFQDDGSLTKERGSLLLDTTRMWKHAGELGARARPLLDAWNLLHR